MGGKGILKASKQFWTSPDQDLVKAKHLLLEEVTLISIKLDPYSMLEGDGGVYTMYCESKHFDEEKYGPSHQYSVCFFNRDNDEIDIEITP